MFRPMTTTGDAVAAGEAVGARLPEDEGPVVVRRAPGLLDGQPHDRQAGRRPAVDGPVVTLDGRVTHQEAAADGGQFLLRPLVLTGADSGTDIDYYRGVVGARGEFGGFAKGWYWDTHVQYSRSEGDYIQDVTLADSVFTQDFRTRSCVGLVTPVTGKPCIDIDWTDPRVLRGDFTDEEREFLFDTDRGHTLFKQLSGEATISGWSPGRRDPIDKFTFFPTTSLTTLMICLTERPSPVPKLYASKLESCESNKCSDRKCAAARSLT